MNDTDTTTIPATPDLDGAKGQSNCVVGCKKLCRNLPVGACGNADDADRSNALAKERIKSLALDYACMFAYGTGDKTDKAWADFLAAVDEALAC